MRVISGTRRGRKLIAPPGLDTRPTSDRIKETLFNMLSEYLTDALFLDLFSGTGAIGIEALSRGAKTAVFVDHSKDCAAVIQKNIANTGFSSQSSIICSDFLSAIDSLKQRDMVFDVIFMDPPYGKDLTAQALTAIVNSEILHKQGLAVIEQSAQAPLPQANGLFIYKHKTTKTTELVFMRHIS